MNNIKIDLHIHTKYSWDSFMNIKKIIKIAKKRGLDGIAITDHDTIAGVKEAQKIAKELDFLIIPGEEITLKNGGELLALFINEKIERSSFFDVYDKVKDQDGVIILPHPFRKANSTIKKLNKKELSKLKIIEGINSVCSEEDNKKAINFANENSLITTAGSDAHSYNLIGKAYTLFSNNKDLRKELIQGKINIEGHSISLFDRTKAFIIREIRLKNYKNLIKYPLRYIKQK